MEKLEKKIMVSNKLGLHGRAAAKLVETASRFGADIRLVRDECEADCKSILDVMTMACTQGTPMAIRAYGGDAAEAIQALEELINGKFGEE